MGGRRRSPKSRQPGKNTIIYFFLNEIGQEEWADLDDIESFWIAQVKRFFAGMPFSLSLDASCALRHTGAGRRGTSDQASGEFDRRKNCRRCASSPDRRQTGLRPGIWSIGTSFSTADTVEGHPGDFTVGGAAIHVTAYPGEAVIDECMENLAQGHKADMGFSFKAATCLCLLRHRYLSQTKVLGKTFTPQ